VNGALKALIVEDSAEDTELICVADVVEAMMSHRPYRPARSFAETLAEIEQGAGTLYDQDCVAVCANLLWDQGYQLGSSDG